MKYGELGRSGMNVSKICLGTMHFGPRATEEESHAILDKALSMGITFIDTANVYGGETARGRSEEIIGTWFAARPGVRDEVGRREACLHLVVRRGDAERSDRRRSMPRHAPNLTRHLDR